MNRRKLTTFLAAIPLAAVAMLAGPTVALADDSESDATAVNVADQVVISSTAASTEGDGSAEATSVAVGGETVVGGTQEGEGEQSGEMFSTGDHEDGALTIGGWQAMVTGDESYARTALVDGRLGDTGSDQYATVTVLESESHATESDGSNASTTGARIDLGGQLMLELLHAETSSDGSGSSAVAYINDEGILTSEQFEGRCAIPADPLANLLCLYANEDSGDTKIPDEAGDAGVAHLVALDGNIIGKLFQASAAPADDTAVLADELAPSEDEGDVSPAAAGTLPRTGGGITAALLGLGMLGAGGALERFRRRS